MALKLTTFGGIRPKADPRSLGDMEAQQAVNCVLDRGHIRPLLAPALDGVCPAGTKTLFPYRFDWLTWPEDVDVVESPLSGDQYERIYYTGDGAPKVRGVVGVNVITADLGIPRPSEPVEVTVIDASALNWTRTWGYFYEEPDGTQVDEGTLAEGSGVVVVKAGEEYKVTAIPPRVTASRLARFVLWFEAKKTGGALLGRVYPNISAYKGNTDLFIQGAAVSARQRTKSSEVVFTLSYDTTEASNYTLDRSYVYTLVSSFGEEGPPSLPSEIVSVAPNKHATITGMDTDLPERIVKKRIYRTVTGDSGAALQFVAEVDAIEATFTDTVDESDTGEILPSQEWIAPEADMRGLMAMPGGFLVGFKGKTLCFSAPGYPHAWPLRYQVDMDANIVALKVSGYTIAVLTDESPYLVTAPDPESVSVQKIATKAPCISKRGAFEFGGAVFYPSHDGLIQISGLAAVVITDPYFTKDQWAAYNPEAMIAAVYDNTVHTFGPTGGLIMEFFGDGIRITTHTYQATAVYVDDGDALMYLVIGAERVIWDAGQPATAVWQGKEYAFPRPVDFGVARVVADGYPVSLSYIANGQSVLVLGMIQDTARRVPVVRPEKFWSFRMSSEHVIRELTISHSMGDL